MRHTLYDIARAYSTIREAAMPVMVTTNVPADHLEFEGGYSEDETDETGECEASDIEMALNQLRKISEVAPELLSILEHKSDLDGWALIKLAKAADYVSGVHDYYKYKDDCDCQDTEQDDDHSIMFQVGYENL